MYDLDIIFGGTDCVEIGRYNTIEAAFDVYWSIRSDSTYRNAKSYILQDKTTGAYIKFPRALFKKEREKQKALLAMQDIHDINKIADNLKMMQRLNNEHSSKTHFLIRKDDDGFYDIVDVGNDLKQIEEIKKKNQELDKQNNLAYTYIVAVNVTMTKVENW